MSREGFLWPSSPVCSLCPSCPALALPPPKKLHLCKKTLGMLQKKERKKKKENISMASDQKGVSKVAINPNQVVWHT